MVDLAEVEANGYDLNVGRYIKTETEAELNVEAALTAYREAREQFTVLDAVLEKKLKAAGFDA
jgi:type I restriction enzyme M protein